MSKHFDYPVPPLWELREMYETPYRFSKELRESCDLLWKHPKVNKWNILYGNVRRDTDPNDMCKVAYLTVVYAMEHPAQYGGAIDNCMDVVLVRMWKNFLGLNKRLRGQVYSQYMPTPVGKMLSVARGGFLDLLITEIDEEKMHMSNDDMVKEREGIGLRECKSRKGVGYDRVQLDYLCSLE